ncbi:MAG: tRNA pseudouridine(38-40) synthase TruA [Clostridia bacterium]|nr:tRNA pseudouridine(38-40) synthase TruA [Clostridia bacterium]
MRNLLLTICFDGSAYHGWQVQENAVTVQQTLQDALEQIIHKRDNITGCSRTDSGVHANMYCCNIRTQSGIECSKLVSALNAVLPDDIAVRNCIEASPDFHARYNCKSKEYIYRIWNSKCRNPFEYKHTFQYKYPLDEVFLDSQAKDFTGKHDFSAFCAAGSSVEDTVRTVTCAQVSRDGDLVTFRVCADGFLYNMVRIMVGTLIEISEGKIAPGTIPEIIKSGDRSNSGFTARPEGLFLNRVEY